MGGLLHAWTAEAPICFVLPLPTRLSILQARCWARWQRWRRWRRAALAWSQTPSPRACGMRRTCWRPPASASQTAAACPPLVCYQPACLGVEALACPSHAVPAASSPPSHHSAQPPRCAWATYVAGSDLVAHGALGTVYAGFHYDLNFLTIHGRSREWASKAAAALQPGGSCTICSVAALVFCRQAGVEPARPMSRPPHACRLPRALCVAGRRAAHPRPHPRRLPLGAGERQAGGPCLRSLLPPFGSTGGLRGMLGMAVQPAAGCLLA